MSAARESYRKLPGHRRGLIHGASLWMGADHILSIKSMRFREEYKKFYLRDVQAIAVARAPRFHISTRAIAIAAVWLMALVASYFVPAVRNIRARPWLWAITLALIAVWAYVSALCSCRCRLFTAVSREDLPSVYRTWTTRRFLDALEPAIGAAQGVIEGEWAEAAESRDIGPREEFPPEAAAAGGSVHAARAHTTASDIFVGTLFAAGAAALLTLNAAPNLAHSLWAVFLMLKIAGATAVFVQHYKGKLKGGMQKLAIAALLTAGASFYVTQFTAQIAASRSRAPAIAPVLGLGSRLATEVDGGCSLLLGCIGVGLIVTGRDVRDG